MKIVRAMKAVSRTQGEIKELKKRISACLNTLEDNEFKESFKDLMAELDEKTAALINLKTSIMKSNIIGGAFEKIAKLGELKSRMDFLRELVPKEGTIERDYGDSTQKYKSQWTLLEKNTEISKCQIAINNLVDELDEFNAKTDC
jgi:hypothetical protein